MMGLFQIADGMCASVVVVVVCVVCVIVVVCVVCVLSRVARPYLENEGGQLKDYLTLHLNQLLQKRRREFILGSHTTTHT